MPDGAATAQANGTAARYLHQVDALRLLAVVVVMFHHYMDNVHFPLFGKGVILFFFLSGYFSTRQLLKLKDRLAESRQPLRRAVKVFYARRYIRILPMYFAVVLVSAAAGLPHAREALPWLATFTTNWHILLTGDWIGPFSPFWSLALLEQFYLFWPWLLLAVPRAWEARVMLAVAAVAFLWRGWCLATAADPFLWFVVPWAGFDQIALGALAALLHARGAAAAPALAVVRRYGLLVAGPWSLFLLYGYQWGGLAGVHYVYEPALNCVFFIWLVDAASRGISGSFGKAMSNGVVCALGRASYSIFALHEFTYFLIPAAVRRPLSPVLDTYWSWTILIPLTLLVAWLAYRYVEKPINQLKKFFIL